MNSREFKTLFGEVAKVKNFKKAFSGWYKESNVGIAILELQKSNFGDYYQLNIKVFINGVFGKTYSPSKDLIKSALGHINSNETKEYQDVLDFDKLMEDTVRKEKVMELFEKHIIPFTNTALTKTGLKVLENQIFLLPAIKGELNKLS